MAVPPFEAFMVNTLKVMVDGKTRSHSDFIELVAQDYGITEQDRLEMLPSLTEARYHNRIGWAIFEELRAGLFERPSRGMYKITQRGLDVLKSRPDKIDCNYLMRFREYQEYQLRCKNGRNTQEAVCEKQSESSATPFETIQIAYRELNNSLAAELLDELKKTKPHFFEKIVIRLLLSMGYGNFNKDAGSVTGKSGDEGIDGEISEDKLGLEKIYVQAKRYKDTTIGRPTIQQFAGSLLGKKANKGVFITTSDFSSEAKEYAKLAGQNIILISGQKLVELMIEHNVGVSQLESYAIKKVDHDYFSDEDI